MASAAVKKVTKKQSTTRRIFPTKIKGWNEFVADAYGHSPSTRNWIVSSLPEIEAKKANEDNTLVTFKRGVSVNVVGEVTSQTDDGKIHLKIDNESFGLLKEVEDYLLDKAVALAKDKHEDLPHKNLRITWGDDRLTIKNKWINRYTKIFKNAEPDQIGNIDEIKVHLILNFYGFFVLKGEDEEKDGAVGLLCSIKALNVDSSDSN